MPSDPSETAKRTNRGNRGRALARIHIARKELAMTEEEYREMLSACTGLSSCGAMTLAQLSAVEHYLKTRMGWKAQPLKNRRDNQGTRLSPASRHKEYRQKKPVDKIRALWIDMARAGLIRDGSENAMERWLIRMSARHNGGRGIEKLDWLNAPQGQWLAQRLIESLKQWRARLEKTAGKIDRQKNDQRQI